MRSASSQLVKILAVLLSGTATTFGDNTMDIRVYNNSPDEIVVTVYDMNATPPVPVLDRQRIDGFAWIPALVTPGFEGSGHVRWIAGTTGTSFHRCGHDEKRGLGDDAILQVYADSECVKSTHW